MKIYIFILLFILCVLLPFMFKLLEGMEYNTELLDKAPKFISPPEELELIDLSYNEM